MTTPAPRHSRPESRDSRSSTALYEQMHQIAEQLKVASDLLVQSMGGGPGGGGTGGGTGSGPGPWALDRTLRDTNKILEQMSEQLQVGMPGQFGPVIGGVRTPGYAFSRPLMPGYLPPTGSVPQGGYPGPGNPNYAGGQYGYGYGGGYEAAAFGYGPPMGMLGRMQQRAAGSMHSRWGLGRTTGAVDEQGQPVTSSSSVMGYSKRQDGSYNVQYADGSRGIISAQQYQTRATVSGVAQGLQSGEGMTGVMGAVSRIPGVGQALEAGETGIRFGNFVGEQRSANAAYQSIYGPGTSGASQRWQNFSGRVGNSISNALSAFGIGSGGLSDADYNKAFQGISAMGYQGGTRGNMMNFATNNFNTMGMSVDESLQVIGINSKTASTNLAELNNQLKQVSQMAQQAGNSSDVFRQKFIQSYGTAVNAGFGYGSGALAVANTAATAGQGRMFASWDTSSMYSSVSGQQMLASYSGYQSVAQFAFAAQSNPMVVAEAQQNLINAQLDQVATPEATQYAQQLIKQAGGAGNVQNNQSRAQQIAGQVISRYANGVNPYAIYVGLTTVGMQVDPNNTTALITYWVQWLASKGSNVTSQVAQQQKNIDQVNLNAKGAMGSTAVQADKNRMVKDQMPSSLGGKGGGNSGSVYVSGKTKQFDPVIAKMEDQGITQVQVQTSQGPALVSLSDAAKNYRGQLTDGTAILASGKNAGQSVSDIFGTESSAKYATGENTKAKGAIIPVKQYQQLLNSGVSSQQINSIAAMLQAGGMQADVARQMLKNPAAMAAQAAQNTGAGSNGSIVVTMTPALQKYLNLNVAGSSLVNGSAATNSTPVIPATGSSTGH